MTNGTCKYIISEGKICGRKLAHFHHGLVDFYYCPKCQTEIRRDDLSIKKKEKNRSWLNWQVKEDVHT